MLSSFKHGVANAFLFAAARNGQTSLLGLLCSAGTAGTSVVTQAADVNCVDEMHRSPL